MAMLMERVRALQGGLPLDEAALSRRQAAVAAGTAITADNLAQRVMQAIQAGETTQLDNCLTAPVGHAAIRAAAPQLAPAAAEAALRAAFSRLRRRPGRGQQMGVWIHALLLSHAHHLQASRDAQTLLGGLHGAAAAAAAAQGPLLQLAGRLDLALAQIADASRPAALEFDDDGADQAEARVVDALVDAPPEAGAAVEVDSEDAEDADDAFASDSGAESEEGGSDDEGISD